MTRAQNNYVLTSPQYSISHSSTGQVYYSNSNLNWNPTDPNDLNISGDIKIKGKSLTDRLSKIEDRLSIILDPDPDKLKKFQALQKAYDQYKLIEKLCHEENDKK